MFYSWFSQARIISGVSFKGDIELSIISVEVVLQIMRGWRGTFFAPTLRRPGELARRLKQLSSECNLILSEGLPVVVAVGSLVMRLWWTEVNVNLLRKIFLFWFSWFSFLSARTICTEISAKNFRQMVLVFFLAPKTGTGLSCTIYKIPINVSLSLDMKPGTSNPDKWYRKFRSFR